MRRCLLRYLLFPAVLCGLAVVTPRAETSVDTVASLPGIEITTAVDRAEVYIGDLVEYTVSITYDTTYELEPPPLGANLGAFDVKDYQPDIETRLPDGRINSKTIFKLSTFTTGDYVIPPVPVVFRLPDSSVKVLLAEPVPIRVLSLLAEAGDSLDIRPLKAPYAFPADYSAYLLWGGAGALLLAAGLLFWWWRRRRLQPAEPVDTRDPWEIAFERLARLSQRNLPDAGEMEEYYMELSETLRWYLGRMYDIDVLEMTTDEFCDRFATVELPADTYNQATAFLKHADLVKFARYTPPRERAEEDFTVVYRMVEAVREDYQRRHAAAAEAAVTSAPASTAGGGQG